MTDREKAIVMAYTGTTMLTGEKFSIFHKYIEDILGRPVWTHELADRSVWEEIKEKSKSDFLELCKNEERPQGEWVFLKANEEQTDGYECSVCKKTYHTRVPYFSEFNFCPNCGADMRKPNCVRCDHFGDCDGCERSGEE